MPPRRPATIVDDYATLRADYSAAKQSRFRRRRTGLPTMGAGADYHYRNEADYLKVMEYARDMDRNDCIVGQTIDRARDNLIQDGFTLTPQTGDPALDKDLAARWYDYANDPEQCDVDGQRSWWDIECDVTRAMFFDGDMTVLALGSGALQLVEAHRLRTPTYSKNAAIVHGVEYARATTSAGEINTRRPARYWFTREDVGTAEPALKLDQFTAIDAQDAQGRSQVFHVRDTKRVSQTRGMSALTPVFDLCGMFDDIQFATLLHRQIISSFVIFKEKTDKYTDLLAARCANNPGYTEAAPDGSSRSIEGLGPARVFEGGAGEKFHLDSPNVPNAEFFPHMKLILTLIGINLGLPLVMVLMDASETNFSGWRGAIDQAQRGFKRKQRKISERLHRPAYRWQVARWLDDDEALRRAAARSDVTIFDHRWAPPAWPFSIQPLQDASADLVRTRNALISQRRRCAERGMEWSDLSTEIVEDNAELIEKAYAKAEELNKKCPGLNVTWREIASLPLAEGLQIAIPTDSTETGHAQAA